MEEGGLRMTHGSKESLTRVIKYTIDYRYQELEPPGPNLATR